jgi:hypothetical protein
MTREAIYFIHIQYRVFMTHAGDHVIIWKTWDKALSSSIWMKNFHLSDTSSCELTPRHSPDTPVSLA